MRTRTRARLAAVVAAATALLGGCAAGQERTPLTVYAAASLAEAFEDVAAAFEAEHTGIDVRPIVSDGSNVLVTQIEEGARADVLATADERSIARLGGMLASTEVFATNTLVIAVAPHAAGDIRGLADLADLADSDLAGADLDVVLCAAAVPCGAASHALLERAGVTLVPASEEQNVTAVLTKVETGVADAGLVYRTDVRGRDVDVVEPEEAAGVVNRYPIGVLRNAPHPEAAALFAAFVSSAAGQEILAEHGFGPPGR